MTELTADELAALRIGFANPTARKSAIGYAINDMIRALDMLAARDATSGAQWTLISNIRMAIQKCFIDRMMPFSDFAEAAREWHATVVTEGHPDTLRKLLAARDAEIAALRAIGFTGPTTRDNVPIVSCKFVYRFTLAFGAVTELKVMPDYRAVHYDGVNWPATECYSTEEAAHAAHDAALTATQEPRP